MAAVTPVCDPSAHVYTENRINDLALVCKAFASNQLARFAPAAYTRLTRETGRGKGRDDPHETAAYFRACFDEYVVQFGNDPEGAGLFFRDKAVLEYGPGDTLGVALLLYAHGASCVTCVDRFAFPTISADNIDTYRILLDGLPPRERMRADQAFCEPGRPLSGFAPHAIDYRVTADGLSGASEAYDIILSRAVLEHVNDLRGTMADIARALKPGGVSLHQVDLKSHGLDRYQPFDFLTWPETLYRLMYSHKGFPNRWRVDKYRELAVSAGLDIVRLAPTGCLDAREVEVIGDAVAPAFLQVPRDELGWLGFWMMIDRGRPLVAST